MQISFDTNPLVVKHSNKMKIKSSKTNTIVTKNNIFVGNTFNLTMLNNKYIVATTSKIEKIIPNILPATFCFLFFFIFRISSHLHILLHLLNFYKKLVKLIFYSILFNTDPKTKVPALFNRSIDSFATFLSVSFMDNTRIVPSTRCVIGIAS